jgi:hypothetical protein
MKTTGKRHTPTAANSPANPTKSPAWMDNNRVSLNDCSTFAIPAETNAHPAFCEALGCVGLAPALVISKRRFFGVKKDAV